MSESGVERAERDILELSVEDRDELMDRVVPPWIEGLPAAKRERMGEIFGRAGESEAAGEVDWTAAAVDRPIPDAVVAIGSAPIVPAGEVGMLAGFGGAGKSRLIAQIAVAAAGTADGELTPVLHPHTASVGRPGIGDALQVRGGPVVAVGYEDAAPWVRLRAAGAALWLDGGDPGPCSAGGRRPEAIVDGRARSAVVRAAGTGPSASADAEVAGGVRPGRRDRSPPRRRRPGVAGVGRRRRGIRS